MQVPVIARLAVLGDPHGEHARLARALEWAHGQALDAIVCTGDIADGRGCINRCCELLEAAGVQSVLVEANPILVTHKTCHAYSHPPSHALTLTVAVAVTLISTLTSTRLRISTHLRRSRTRPTNLHRSRDRRLDV